MRISCEECRGGPNGDKGGGGKGAFGSGEFLVGLGVYTRLSHCWHG